MERIKHSINSFLSKSSYFFYGLTIASMLGASLYMMRIADERKEALRIICGSIEGDNSLCTFHGFKTIPVMMAQ
jgi:hypothetical protein